MGRKFTFRRKLGGDEMMSMEAMIGSVLLPVAPRQEFVKSLRQRVLSFSLPETENIQEQAKKNIVVLVLSLMGVSIILGVWIRVVVYLLKIFGVDQKPDQRSKKRRITPAHSVA